MQMSRWGGEQVRVPRPVFGPCRMRRYCPYYVAWRVPRRASARHASTTLLVSTARSSAPSAITLIRGPLPPGHVRLSVVCRLTAIVGLVSLVSGDILTMGPWGKNTLGYIGPLLVAMPALALAPILLCCLIGVIFQPARPSEPRYLWTVVIALVTLVVWCGSQTIGYPAL